MVIILSEALALIIRVIVQVTARMSLWMERGKKTTWRRWME